MTDMDKMSGEQKTAVWITALVGLCLLGAILLGRGCEETRYRRVEIQFMPEDAGAVRELIEGAAK